MTNRWLLLLGALLVVSWLGVIKKLPFQKSGSVPESSGETLVVKKKNWPKRHIPAEPSKNPTGGLSFSDLSKMVKQNRKISRERIDPNSPAVKFFENLQKENDSPLALPDSHVLDMNKLSEHLKKQGQDRKEKIKKIQSLFGQKAKIEPESKAQSKRERLDQVKNKDESKEKRKPAAE